MTYGQVVSQQLSICPLSTRNSSEPRLAICLLLPSLSPAASRASVFPAAPAAPFCGRRAGPAAALPLGAPRPCPAPAAPAPLTSAAPRRPPALTAAPGPREPPPPPLPRLSVRPSVRGRATLRPGRPGNFPTAATGGGGSASFPGGGRAGRSGFRPRPPPPRTCRDARRRAAPPSSSLRPRPPPPPQHPRRGPGRNSP